MQAVIEYENGEVGALVGLQGFGREIVARILEGHEAVRIWLIQDGDPWECYGAEEPYWTMETVWVFRADGRLAKVMLPSFTGETFWDAMEREFPQSCEDIPGEAFETADQVQYRLWDACFRPGQDAKLSAWLKEGEE